MYVYICVASRRQLKRSMRKAVEQEDYKAAVEIKKEVAVLRAQVRAAVQKEREREAFLMQYILGFDFMCVCGGGGEGGAGVCVRPYRKREAFLIQHILGFDFMCGRGLSVRMLIILCC